jgi:hypothetical protein
MLTVETGLWLFVFSLYLGLIVGVIIFDGGFTPFRSPTKKSLIGNCIIELSCILGIFSTLIIGFNAKSNNPAESTCLFMMALIITLLLGIHTETINQFRIYYENRKNKQEKPETAENPS